MVKIKKALNACKKYNPVILDQTNKSAVIQITALRREIDNSDKKFKTTWSCQCLKNWSGSNDKRCRNFKLITIKEKKNENVL